MISIKRRRRRKFLIILFSILIIIISSILIYGFFPYGLHKKYMHKVKMPKDSIVYISAKNLNNNLLNEIKISDFLQTFNNLKNNSNLSAKIISSILNRRNFSILLWQYNNNFEDSELFYFLDTGKLINLFANNFLNIKKLNIGKIEYDINKINYDGMKFFIVGNDKPFLYFAFYNGLLIITKNYINLKKIIYFLSSKTNTLKEIDILNQIPISYNSDISFYINKNLFDLPNINNFALLNILQYFKKDIYGAIKLKEDIIKLNIFIDYKKDDIDILTLYTLKGLNNIPIKIFNYNNSVIKNAIVKSNYINIDIDLK
ncbi:hypothetical protein [Brachyspira aalborgi]|uniref:hypothetical protein n=1 Tax=Brachyspira aalborgi TaxID=29522 RepID=UPI00266B4DE9|nr:hypothetical protein [Brachyspira aalborgi]